MEFADLINGNVLDNVAELSVLKCPRLGRKSIDQVF